LDYFLGI